VKRGCSLALLMVGIGLSPAGCRRAAPAPARRYAIEGRVVAVESASRTLTLSHEAIEGFMPAMTMPFEVAHADAPLLSAMAPGDAVSATLVFAGSRSWLEGLVLHKRAVPQPGTGPSALPREPEPGDPAPEVALVDQSGHRLRLADYRGRALALSFVFTRCPLPDFCPLLMRNFALAEASLATDPLLLRRTALLSVSFDVEHDTPQVLRDYGLPYQKTRPPFSHWRLASGPLPEMRKLGAAYGLEFEEDSGSFTHNLRTAVLGPDGRLRRLLRGNDWKPDELVAELRAAAGS
jgi:protein SCO1/2